MQTIKIETTFDLDGYDAAKLFREIADTIESEGDTMEDRELMDGSYRIDSSLGVVFLSFQDDE